MGKAVLDLSDKTFYQDVEIAAINGMKQDVLKAISIFGGCELMLNDVFENGVHLILEIDTEQRLNLRYLGLEKNPTINNDRYEPAFEIGLTSGYGSFKKKINCGSEKFKVLNFRENKNYNGKLIEYDLSDGSLLITLHYQFYDGISTIRSYTVVTNQSEMNQDLFYISSFHYCRIPENDDIMIVNNSWCQELGIRFFKPVELGLNLSVHIGKKVLISNIGTLSAKEYLPIGYTGGLFWQIENNGSWQWELGLNKNLYLSVSGPSDETGWYKSLKPGESFKTVNCAVAVGDNFNVVLGEITKYRRKIKGTNEQFSKQPVIFNDYMNCLWAKPTYENEIPMINAAADIGAECYCMDAGWYADGGWWDNVGEWLPAKTRFTGGLGRIFEYIREKNMIPGIWLEPEVMGRNCPLANKMPDECFFMRYGKRVVNRDRYQLDYRNAIVKDYMTKTIDRLINDYGIGYFKFDYNIDAGVGTEVNSDSFGDGLLKCNRAFIDWVHSLKLKYPDIIFENCSSGGMRMDYAMLSEFHLQSTSDQESHVNTSIIAANAAIGVLPEQAGIWSSPLPHQKIADVFINMVNGMCGCLYLSGKMDELYGDKLECVKTGVKIYKEFRNEISSFIPFYPLGVNFTEKKVYCVGYHANEFDYIFVWKIGNKEENICINTKMKSLYVIYCSDGFVVLENNNNMLYLQLIAGENCGILKLKN